jgi:hypothetical protein
VSATGERVEGPVPAELLVVTEAAGERLRAEVDEDGDAAQRAGESLLSAATSAMAAGYSLSEIARAEARGKEEVKRALGGDALKRVERSGRQARVAQTEHHRAIGRAMRLGLSTREIAIAADVTHGTIRAISNRLALRASTWPAESDQPGEDQGQQEETGAEATVADEGL